MARKVFPFLLLTLITLPLLTEAAVFHLLPSSGRIYLGESILVQLKVDTEAETINAVEAELNFPRNNLEVVSVTKGGSVFSFWPEEPFYSNETGTIRLVAGLPNGFSGDGLLGNIILRPRLVGQFTFNFNPLSQALLNDGLGTAANLVLLDANYEVIAKPLGLTEVSSSTHPNQDEWFKSATLHLHWDLKEGSEYSFLLSQDALAEPDEVSDYPPGELKWIGDMEYPDLLDGVYYFSLKEKLVTGLWQPKTTYRVMVDATPPEPFDITVAKDDLIFNGKYFISFNALDKTSGISYYEVWETKQGKFWEKETGEWQRATSPHQLENQALGTKIRVKAVDRAGNAYISEIIPARVAVKGQLIIGLATIILALLAIVIVFKKRQRKGR